MDGRKVEAVATAANEQAVQVRVVATQAVHEVRLERLSQEDRDFVAKWRTSSANRGMPDATVPAAWPAVYSGGVVPELVEAEASRRSGERVWRTRRYELHSSAPVDERALRTIASICESIDGVCRSVPLPLMWGRASDVRKIVRIYPNEKAYRAAGGMPGTSGCFIFATGEIHIDGPSLQESDYFGKARGFSLEKRQTYRLLVHELVHQAAIGVTLSNFPAWVPEGLADYIAAVQRSPGHFQFRDSHVAVKASILDSAMFANGLVEPNVYPVWRLEPYMNRSLVEWNRITSGKGNGERAQIQYHQALLMAEYFYRADSPQGHGFRSYLEAVLTGADEADAQRIHLLRGRSYEALEEAIVAYWAKRGLTLRFESAPTFKGVGGRLGIGLDSELHRRSQPAERAR